MTNHIRQEFKAVVFFAALCCSCTQQQILTQQSCVVHVSSSFVGTGSSEGRITVARNGQPCGMAFVQDGRYSTGFVSDPKIVMQPAHGSASARMSNAAALLMYTPDHDYVGPDRFTVAFGPNYRLTVNVDVVPIP